MALEIPVVLQPISLAKKSVQYRGQMRLAHFKRFLQSAAPGGEYVQVELRFFQHAAGLCAVRGRFDCTAKYTCERCLGEVELPIGGDFQIAFVADEQAQEEVPEDWDVFELEASGDVRTIDLLEDELILAQPMLPKHPSGACDPSLEQYFASPSAAPEAAPAETHAQQGKPNPFAVLKELSIKPEGEDD